MKVCERCGKQFSCSIQTSAPCWCKSLGPLKPLPSQYQDCLCSECLTLFRFDRPPEADLLKEGDDFFFERGMMVFTRAYHLKRGYCCQNGCRFCPYSPPII